MCGNSTPGSEPLACLPGDVQRKVLRYLRVEDLLNLALCSRSYRDLITDTAFWDSLVWHRFGQATHHRLLVWHQYNLCQIQRYYATASRMRVIATEINFQRDHDIPLCFSDYKMFLFYAFLPNSMSERVLRLRRIRRLDLVAFFRGVPPGQYQVVWRTMKTDLAVGAPHSRVHMSVTAERVHPTFLSLPGNVRSAVQPEQSLHNFTDLPVNTWVDVTGGEVSVPDFCNVEARLCCHSSEWISCLAWDYVQLIDVNALSAIGVSTQCAATSAKARFAHSFWAKVLRRA